jgi:hypothetical protein
VAELTDPVKVGGGVFLVHLGDYQILKEESVYM